MTSQPIKKTVSNSASINGVDTDALRQTIEAVKENKGIAKFKFKATNKWIHGGHNRTTINEFYGAEQNHTRSNPYDLDADEPPVLLGEDQGANPVEYVLTALSACLTTSLVYHAAARGIRIDEVESHLEGDLDLRGFLGLSESVWGLVLVHTVYGLAFTTLFFRNYYVAVPSELVNAARIDGAGFFRIFWRIMLPISIPIFMVTIIWQTTQIWNDFLFGVCFSTGETQPITVALNNLVNTSSAVKEYNVDMAAAIIAALPTLFVYFVAGKYFVRGLTAGAVKG